MSAQGAHWLTADPRPPVRSGADFDTLKYQFLAVLNHEMRTPLSGILGMIDLLRETGLNPEQGEYAEVIRECADQLLETLNNVLDFSALAGGGNPLEEAEFLLPNLVELVSAEARERARAKGLEFVTELDPALPETLIGDERLIRQAFQHLLRNAVKFTSRGRVGLRLTLGSRNHARIWLRGEVFDTGIGIPAEKLRLIFESFRQLDDGLARRYGGLGVGLATVDKIVKLMRGELQVTSNPGQGSSFELLLPFRLAWPDRLAATPEATAEAGNRTWKVLLVDDNDVAQQLIPRLLETAGYDCATARDGRAAVQSAVQSQFDVVLVDLQMPDLDGFTTAQQVRALPGYEQVPIIALSVRNSDLERRRWTDLGMQAYLVKPLKPDLLVATVRDHLLS